MLEVVFAMVYACLDAAFAMFNAWQKLHLPCLIHFCVLQPEWTEGNILPFATIDGDQDGFTHHGIGADVTTLDFVRLCMGCGDSNPEKYLRNSDFWVPVSLALFLAARPGSTGFRNRDFVLGDWVSVSLEAKVSGICHG